MKKRVLRALVIALLLAVIAPAALASSVAARVNADTRIYQSPSKSARWMEVSSGLKVTLKSYSDGWGRITCKGKTAYIPVQYLTLTNPIKAYASAKSIIYKYPGTDKLGTVERGTALYVIGVDEKYVHVQNKSGSAKGYIKASNLTRSKPAEADGSAASGASQASGETSAADTSNVERAVSLAKSLLGAPYSDKSKPPKSFDCATFTHYCYNKVRSGAVKSSPKSQGYDSRYAKITSVSSLARGDLVCFDTVNDDDLSDHVGIYLGKGDFIHASSAAGKVITSSLDSGYYHRTFSWGLRIFSD